jgi:hypothetical protein
MIKLKRVARFQPTGEQVAVVKLQCPTCGVWGDLDDDQLHGRVSVECQTPGCSFHETHDFSRMEMSL